MARPKIKTADQLSNFLKDHVKSNVVPTPVLFPSTTFNEGHFTTAYTASRHAADRVKGKLDIDLAAQQQTVIATAVTTSEAKRRFK